MKATLVRADLIYEAQFKRPIFDQGRDAPPLIQSLYNALSDNFPISLADVNSNILAAPAQVFVAMNLFGQAGAIELRLDRWRATFRGIRTPDDRTLIIRCLNIASDALQNASERIKIARTNVTISAWFICDEGKNGVSGLLSKHGSLEIELSQGFLGAQEFEYSISPRMRNTAEGWDATFLIQNSQAEGSDLFVNSTTTYIDDGRYNSIDEKSAHATSMIKGLLQSLDVTLAYA